MLPFYQNIPLFSIFAALLAAVFSVLLKSKAAWRLHMITTGLIAGASLWMLVRVLQAGASFTYRMGRFGAPWGNELRAGPFEAAMAILFCLVMLCSVLGGTRDLREEILSEKRNLYFIMLNLLLASVLGLIYTNDIFTGYVFLELNTVAACALVMSKDTPQTVVATLRYLVLSLLGSGLFLFSVALLYAITGHLLMPNLQLALAILVKTNAYRPAMLILACLMVVALAIKSALYPFHTWMPEASGNSTTTTSAILSGVILKSYIVLLVKLLCRVFTLPLVRELGLNDVLFALGLLAMVMGSVNAMRESHLKRMVAYSTVAQIGYIYIGIGIGVSSGLIAAMLQLVIHSVAKALLLISSGGLIDESGHHKQLYALKGAGYRNRIAGFGFTLGGLSMVGLPLLGGFIAKLYLADAALLAGWRLPAALIVLGVSSVLNALYYIPAIIRIWTADVDEHGAPVAVVSHHEPHRAAAILILSACIVLLGVSYEPVAHILRVGIELL